MSISHHHKNDTKDFCALYSIGFHPTATRAAMLLLRLGTCMSNRQASPVYEYHLCTFTTETVLSFCVDRMQVIVADISSDYGRLSDFSSSAARTCLVVDNTPDSKDVATTAWSATSPPVHFVFLSMSYDRALGWLQKWQNNDIMTTRGISLDMYDTYHDDLRTVLMGVASSNLLLLELTMPSKISATDIGPSFLEECTRLTFLDALFLTNVTQIGSNFLCGCSSLVSLDLSSLTNVKTISDHFLSGCTSLTSLDLSALTNVSKIGDYFLHGCSSLTSITDH
eukprot:PhM_4_TR18649/c2_g8_i1/m.23165